MALTLKLLEELGPPEPPNDEFPELDSVTDSLVLDDQLELLVWVVLPPLELEFEEDVLDEVTVPDRL